MSGSGEQLDEDAIYRQVGKLVVFFQFLETELVSLASLAIEPANGGWNARPKLANLWFKDLVDRTGVVVHAYTKEYRGDVPEFQKRVEDLLDRCRDLAKYRNKVVHSAYVVLEAGDRLMAILREDMRPTKADPGGPEADREWLGEDSFTAALTEIAHVTSGIAQCRTQLVMWHARSERAG